MRILTLALVGGGMLAALASARAQTYDPSYPVCMHVFDKGANYYHCVYTSLPQCNLSASGRAAQCEVNPFFQGPPVYDAPRLHVRPHRRHHRHAHAD